MTALGTVHVQAHQAHARRPPAAGALRALRALQGVPQRTQPPASAAAAFVSCSDVLGGRLSSRTPSKEGDEFSSEQPASMSYRRSTVIWRAHRL
ncbi:hypothetical protein GCM10010361_29680 [Streptomyces olivaceiscleroticus]|uniref:Uncharacterized protein n=1 Tax=Streptomyces olivaceiscleroticus TaxID=68245 RepID=A0ABP3JTD3_9ACTN